MIKQPSSVNYGMQSSARTFKRMQMLRCIYSYDARVQLQIPVPGVVARHGMHIAVALDTSLRLLSACKPGDVFTDSPCIVWLTIDTLRTCLDYTQKPKSL